MEKGFQVSVILLMVALQGKIANREKCMENIEVLENIEQNKSITNADYKV